MSYANNVIDLFSGAGGLSLGAARAGFVVCGAVDNDSEAAKTHERNFPNTLHSADDVSKFTGPSLKHLFGLENGDLAGIIGGPPCQGFSTMGKRDVDDDRNSLFIDFFRIVAEAHPKFFLAENVPNILNDVYSAVREKALSNVRNTYVVLKPITVEADEYGAPTSRKRVLFIGYLRDEMEKVTPSDFKPPASTKKAFVKDALLGLPEKIDPDWQKEEQSWKPVSADGRGYYMSRLQSRIPPGIGDPESLKLLAKRNLASGFLGTRHSREVAERYSKVEWGKYDHISKSVKLDPNGFCPTLRAGTGADHGSFQAVRPLHPTENRVIAPREAARLQGFPDWFRFSPTKWHSFRQIGSSVSPIVAERILSVIRKALDSKIELNYEEENG